MLKMEKHKYRFFKNIKKVLLNIFKSFCIFCEDIAFGCKKLWLCLKRKPIINAYLKSHNVKKLQIGSGANPLSGWLNTDLYPGSKRAIYLDATEPFPLDDNTFDYAFCEHMIEHVTYNQGLFVLKECFRVLKPEGKMRLSTPDLQIYLDLFVKEKSELQRRYMDWISSGWLQRQQIFSKNESFILNLVMHGWGHVFVYDAKTLKEALESVGFTNIMQYTSGVSHDDNLKDIEGHGNFIGNNEMNKYETLVLEAVKPS